MWKCPVCDQENNAATVCPTCGYDRTCDYERYPTAFTVKRATPTRALRRQWQEKQNPPTKPQPRPAEAKPRPAAPPVAAPASVPTPAAAPAKKKGSLWKVLLAVAVIAIVIAAVNQEKSANGDNLPVEYTEGSTEDYVNIKLGDGSISDQMVEDTQNLLKEHSCTKIQISGGTVDAAAMEQISKLTDVETIVFYYCTKVSGFDRLSGMPNLSLIDLTSPLESELDLTGIESIGNLEALYVWGFESINLEKLKNAVQLTNLDVRRCNITSLNGLEDLTNLKTLNLNNNQISDLRPLSGLTNLMHLYLSNNNITTLSGLENLTSLTYLNVCDNQITTLAGLENLTNLTDIYASGNPLTDTSALEVSGCMDALHMD